MIAAHDAYTWDELAAAIRKAYTGINEVLILKKLTNFRDSIQPYLNVANSTPGALTVATFATEVLVQLFHPMA